LKAPEFANAIGEIVAHSACVPIRAAARRVRVRLQAYSPWVYAAARCGS
jgi:hypothetical protein